MGSELSDREGSGPMAGEEPIPGFCLTAHEAAQLMSILTSYSPYKNGTTAIFWHIVGLIGSAREEPRLPTDRDGAPNNG